jgi:hypothetical protein
MIFNNMCLNIFHEHQWYLQWTYRPYPKMQAECYAADPIQNTAQLSYLSVSWNRKRLAWILGEFGMECIFPLLLTAEEIEIYVATRSM